MKCSYCQTEMQIATVQKKRWVPSGAKDLGLMEQVTCWQCPKCGLTAELIYSKCLGCGAVVGPKEVQTRAENLSGGCTDCLKCPECGTALKHALLYVDEVKYDYWYSGKIVEGKIPVYYHFSCYTVKIKREKEQERQLELQQQEKRKQMIETRIRDGLCVECGKPLGFVDILKGRQQHKNC